MAWDDVASDTLGGGSAQGTIGGSWNDPLGGTDDSGGWGGVRDLFAGALGFAVGGPIGALAAGLGSAWQGGRLPSFSMDDKELRGMFPGAFGQSQPGESEGGIAGLVGSPENISPGAGRDDRLRGGAGEDALTVRPGTSIPKVPRGIVPGQGALKVNPYLGNILRYGLGREHRWFK